MTIYQTIARLGPKVLPKHKLFKYGFNLSPMYRRSTARITEVSADLHHVVVKLPISYRNRNYVGSIFGGSMFSAVDPVPMVQLMNLLGDGYVVWDKSAQIQFKVPAKEDLYADFSYSEEELNDIVANVNKHQETHIEKLTKLTDETRSQVFCEVNKTIYIASKSHYKEKLKRRLNRESTT